MLVPGGTAATLLSAALPVAPVVVHDAREASPLSSVAAFADRVPGVRGAPPRPTAYRRVAAARGGGVWVQFWLFFEDNPQDRGIVRTGRHEGDWEVLQVRVDATGQPQEAVVSQHSGAERCPWREVRREGRAPVVYAASGSHALYLRPGVRDRTWPDPNDEARGDGARTRPRVETVSGRDPAWMRWPGRWGATRAGWVPGESDSPRGPAFQGIRWRDPDAFAASAAPCRAARCDERGECDAKETALGVGAAAALLAALAGASRRLGRRRGPGRAWRRGARGDRGRRR